MKTISDFLRMKKDGEKIVMLTAYDYPSARLAQEAGVDVILVGIRWGWSCLATTPPCP